MYVGIALIVGILFHTVLRYLSEVKKKATCAFFTLLMISFAMLGIIIGANYVLCLEGAIRWFISTVIVIIIDLVVVHSLIAFVIIGIMVQRQDDTAQKTGEDKDVVIFIENKANVKVDNESD